MNQKPGPGIIVSYSHLTGNFLSSFFEILNQFATVLLRDFVIYLTL